MRQRRERVKNTKGGGSSSSSGLGGGNLTGGTLAEGFADADLGAEIIHVSIYLLAFL